MRKSFLAVAALTLAVSLPVLAEDQVTESTRMVLTSTDYISVLGGYALPDTGRDVKRRGGAFGFIYGVQFAPHLAFESRLHGSVLDTGKNGGTDFYQWGQTFDLVYGFADRRDSFTPFALIGLGAIRNDFTPRSRDQSDFAANAGLGFVTKPLFFNVKLRAEGRYIYDTYEHGQHDFEATMGFEIPLGLTKEHLTVRKLADQVEVREIEKQVPRTIVDSDGDTVGDDLDKCPDTPKGLKVDAEGCVIAGQIGELQGVVFNPRSSVLQLNAQTVLDLAAKALMNQPTVYVELIGHADGSETGGKALGRARASAARDYLIDKGISPERLKVTSYGSGQPRITPEKTDQDRELNRRVDFHVLDN